MRLSRLVENLPVEDWAAAAARHLRRARRRLVRRPTLALAAVGTGVTAALIGWNALFAQISDHPAPFWGVREGTSVVTVGGAPEVPARSDVVAAVQARLHELGYPLGEANGVLDLRTADAIRRFERERGLTVTGEPSVALLALLGASFPASGRPVASPPVDVASLQTLLNDKGFGPLSVDGVLGPRTRAALSAYVTTPEGREALPAHVRALASEGS